MDGVSINKKNRTITIIVIVELNEEDGYVGINLSDEEECVLSILDRGHALGELLLI